MVCRNCACELLAACKDKALWIERWLQQLEHRDVHDARGNVVNGYAFAAIPDWELRQKLDELRSAIEESNETR